MKQTFIKSKMVCVAQFVASTPFSSQPILTLASDTLVVWVEPSNGDELAFSFRQNLFREQFL